MHSIEPSSHRSSIRARPGTALHRAPLDAATATFQTLRSAEPSGRPLVAGPLRPLSSPRTMRRTTEFPDNFRLPHAFDTAGHPRIDNARLDNRHPYARSSCATAVFRVNWRAEFASFNAAAYLKHYRQRTQRTHCGRRNLLVLEFRAVDGQTAPYCLFAPTGVVMSPRTAGFGNRDRFKLNGKIGLHQAAG